MGSALSALKNQKARLPSNDLVTWNSLIWFVEFQVRCPANSAWNIRFGSKPTNLKFPTFIPEAATIVRTRELVFCMIPQISSFASMSKIDM